MYLGNGLETSCEMQRCLESYSCDADAFKAVARPHKRPSGPARDFWPETALRQDYQVGYFDEM